MTPALAIVLLVMTMLGAIGSLYFKLAHGSTLTELVGDWHLWLGGVSYGAAALLNIWVLRHLDLSVVMPLTGFTYVWTLLVARLVLDEPITPHKATGVALLIGGVTLIALS